MNRKEKITLGIEAEMNFLISGFLNGLCAWLIYRGSPFVPVDFWSRFIDTTITCFLVSVCTAFFSTASAKRYRRQGLRVMSGKGRCKCSEALPEAALPAGCCLFGMCLPLLIALFTVIFYAAGVEALSVVQYVIFKGIWGGLYGALICTVVLMKHLMVKDEQV
ncbi:MAG: hypothetical protein IJP92_14010 [Lachnospiraceae bacterium]|nr:hypothetical protein [Lachnospiraceae bacterium]